HFTPGPEGLEARNLSSQGFENVSMAVRAGEIVGLYGLIGAGRSEFVTTLYGRHKKSAGQVLWEGKDVQINAEHDAIKLGMALAPESRRDQGLCLNLPVGLNLNL
ncbi:ATP-binding cassette domain-containing protein, partial [Mesorhizobium sp. M2D.F.Ca.ET.145.01.1.1]